jgi:uncharacterized protein
MSRDKVDVARRATDAFNRRDFEGAFAELGTPDFEWYPAIVRGLDGGGGYRGPDGVEKYAADIRENWEELQALPEEFRDLGDRVLVLGRLTARGRGSGAPVDTPYAGVFDVRDDRIWRSRVYQDRAEGLHAAGLSEWTPPTTSAPYDSIARVRWRDGRVDDPRDGRRRGNALALRGI